LLASRIDRLEDTTRGTLQKAAVIGRTFFRRVLAAVDETSPDLDKRLSTLLRLDMIREAARVPEVEYIFRNPLTQEAVYQSILLRRRREFHRRVGEVIEDLYLDRIDSFFGLLAYHYALAGERDKSVQFSLKAAGQAVALYAYDDAIQNLLCALEQFDTGEIHETRLLLLEELGNVYHLLRNGEQSIACYQEALRVAANLAGIDPHTPLRLNRKIVQVVNDLKWSVDLANLEQALQSRSIARSYLEQNLDNLISSSPDQETVRVLVTLSNDAWRIQDPPDWETAQSYAQAAVELSDRLDNRVDQSKALGALATVLDGRSFLREHLKVTEQRLEICRQPEFNDLAEVTEATRSLGAALMYVGEYDQALNRLQEAEGLALQIQSIEQQANALGLQAQCWFRLDRWDKVLANEEKWRDLERRYNRERVGET
jgi:tetratricopeptide (TPR) repeat protein